MEAQDWDCITAKTLWRHTVDAYGLKTMRKENGATFIFSLPVKTT